MNHHIIPLHRAALQNLISSRIEVSGIKILGDSLSDPGGENGMYEKKL